MRRRALLAASQSANAVGAWENEYFTIESLQDGTTFSIKSQINYSLNRGSWVTASANTNIRLSSNDRVRISTRLSPVTSERDRVLSISGSFNVSGNIMSLLYGDDFIGQTKISNNYALAYLFYGCTGLVSAENLILPATTLKAYCYRSMFEGCTNMTKAPLLPATSVPNYGYMRLFYGCSKINYIKMLANNVNIYTLSQWVYGVSSTGIFVKHPEATWDITGDSGVPEGWTVITDDYPTNSEGMPDSKEFGFPLFLNTEYMTETDDVIVRYRDIKDIIEPFSSWYSQNRDGYGEVYSDVLYRDRIFIDGYIVTRMYYDQSLDSLMVETQKDYGNDSMIGFSSDGNLYVQILKSQGGGVLEIEFNIDGRYYTAAKEMTWDQWVKSSYYEPSYGGFQIYVVENTVYVYSDTGDWFLIGQKGDDRIIEDTRYELYGPVPGPEL